MRSLRGWVVALALILGIGLAVPEAQGRFWVLVNGALRYIGTATVVGTFTVTGNQTVSGTLTAGNISISDTGLWFWATRSLSSSPANALVNITQNSGLTVGYQMNVGTAAPTATTCGTGAAAAHSNNMAGQITATGATTCTVTFGAPNWTFTPFCSVTDVTSAVALRISAASASAITVTGLTSGDTFNWVCGGGAI